MAVQQMNELHHLARLKRVVLCLLGMQKGHNNEKTMTMLHVAAIYRVIITDDFLVDTQLWPSSLDFPPIFRLAHLLDLCIHMVQGCHWVRHKRAAADTGRKRTPDSSGVCVFFGPGSAWRGSSASGPQLLGRPSC